MDSSIR